MALSENNWFNIRQAISMDFDNETITPTEIEDMLRVLKAGDLELPSTPEEPNPFLQERFETTRRLFSDPQLIAICRIQTSQIAEAKLILRLCLLFKLKEHVEPLENSEEKASLEGSIKNTQTQLVAETRELSLTIPKNFLQRVNYDQIDQILRFAQYPIMFLVIPSIFILSTQFPETMPEITPQTMLALSKAVSLGVLFFMTISILSRLAGQQAPANRKVADRVAAGLFPESDAASPNTERHEHAQQN